MTHRALSGWKGYFGDFLRSVGFESGPISRQRWLYKERRWRTAKSVEDVVDKSCKVTPPMKVEEWAERYSGGGGSWTKWIPFMGGGK